MKLKQIEITTYRFVFDDDEPKQETKFPVLSKNVNTGKTVSKKETVAATVAKPKPATAKDGRRKWTDEEKADIIRRYKAGEYAKAIADSLGTTRQSIQNIIHTAGVTKGRTGVNLKKKKPEQQPDADDNEPVLEATRPIPTASEIEAAEKQRRKELREYRQNKPTAWYLK